VIAAAGFGAAHAWGVAETITSSPACCTFSKATFTTDQGEVVTYQNPGGASHDVTASSNGPDGKPLFASSTIPSGQAPVSGTQYLAAGTYHFFCTVHGPSMSADLVVTGNGSPVPRPAFAVKILSSKLDKVASGGKLKLKVTASTESDGIELTASKGAKKLGSKQNLDLGAGTSRTLKLRLTRAGRRALKGRASAKINVTGTVPFGAPAVAKRRLH
jgi:plastocyanin